MPQHKKLSVVLPTYNEAKNISLIIKKLEGILKDFDYELIVVDDNSPDGTALIAKNFAKRNKRIKVFVRKKEKGLASAIYYGIKKAKHDLVCVMDADLQHPPELIPKMFEKAKKADIVIASRFLKKSKTNFSAFRKFLSKLGIFMASTLLPKIKVKDPLSGFFIINKKILRNVELSLKGFKFLLEVLAKANYKKVIEVPFEFQKRKFGKSKMGFKEIFKFLKLIILLFFQTKEYKRVGKFLIAGVLGIPVNEFFLWFFTEVLNIYYLISAIFSIEISIIFVFLLNEFFVFKEFRAPGMSKFFERMIKANTARIGGMLVNLGTLYFLVEFFSTYYLVSNLLGIFLAFVWNYLSSVKWVWK